MRETRWAFTEKGQAGLQIDALAGDASCEKRSEKARAKSRKEYNRARSSKHKTGKRTSTITEDALRAQ